MKISYFFERKDFYDPRIKKPYYVYKGYYFKLGNERFYPIVLHFTRDEIIISYRNYENGRVYPVYTLYVAEGDINQKILTRKIENYWKLPVWPIREKTRKEMGFENDKLYVDESLLLKSYYSRIYDFSIEDSGEGKRFVKLNLFGYKKDNNVKLSRDSITLFYGDGRRRKTFNRGNKTKRMVQNSLVIEEGCIYTRYVDFRRIILDFVYEIDYANTFSDENFYRLQPIIQNNKLIDALTKYGDYLDALDRLKNSDRKELRQIVRNGLPHRFLKPENEWFRVCFLEEYRDLFTSRNSVFENVEEEVKKSIFEARVVKRKWRRLKFLGKTDTSLRNQIATFFLRRYALKEAFDVLLTLPGAGLKSVPVGLSLFITIFLFALVPLGEFFIDISKNASTMRGSLAFIVPIIMMSGIIIFYFLKRVNLFRLALPRLFFGIAIGWVVMLTQEMWQTAIDLWKNHREKIFIVDIILFIMIFLYIFTDIRNRLVRVSNAQIFRRSLAVLFLSIAISLFQGFYFIQWYGKTMMEMIDKNIVKRRCTVEPAYSWLKNKHIKMMAGVKKVNMRIFQNNSTGSFHCKMGIFSFEFIYMWQVILMQVLSTIFVGVILQFLWEDRPVTEPL